MGQVLVKYQSHQAIFAAIYERWTDDVNLGGQEQLRKNSMKFLDPAEWGHQRARSSRSLGAPPRAGAGADPGQLPWKAAPPRGQVPPPVKVTVTGDGSSALGSAWLGRGSGSGEGGEGGGSGRGSAVTHPGQGAAELPADPMASRPTQGGLDPHPAGQGAQTLTILHEGHPRRPWSPAARVAASHGGGGSRTAAAGGSCGGQGGGGRGSGGATAAAAWPALR